MATTTNAIIHLDQSGLTLLQQQGVPVFLGYICNAIVDALVCAHFGDCVCLLFSNTLLTFTYSFYFIKPRQHDSR
jgi:serine/threonine protein phosphatase PrpC